MLVLTRKPKQSIRIGNDITLSIVRVRGNTVQIGIEAPREVNILRSELIEKSEKLDGNSEAAESHQQASPRQENDPADEELESEFFGLELFQESEEFESPLQQFIFAP